MADPLTSFTGVSSGMDWRSLVEQMMKLERRPIDKLQATIDANTKRKEALNGFQTQLQALKDAADLLMDRKAGATSPFESFGVTATGANAAGRAPVFATAGTGAAPGSYAVRVTTLAREQKWTGAVGHAPGAAIGASFAGTLTLSKAGGTPASIPPITLDGTETLAQVRDKLNALNTGSAPSGVQASLVSVSPTEQRLVLTSTATGAANGFALDDGGTGLLAHLGLDAASRAGNPALSQAATDASFSVDGIPMTRAANTVSDVLPGVTMTLAADGDSVVAVTRRTAVATDAAKAFVDAYNTIQKTAAAQGRDPKAPLYNDGILRTVRGSLASEVIRSVAPAGAPGGVAGVASDLTTLAALGISLQKDGTLTLDASKFTAAAEGRLANVQALLGDRLQALADQVDGLARPLTGIVDQRETNLDIQSARHTARIADIEARLDKRRAALIAQFSKFESSLGRLKAIGDQMGAQFAGLNKSKDG